MAAQSSKRFALFGDSRAVVRRPPQNIVGQSLRFRDAPGCQVKMNKVAHPEKVVDRDLFQDVLLNPDGFLNAPLNEGSEGQVVVSGGDQRRGGYGRPESSFRFVEPLALEQFHSFRIQPFAFFEIEKDMRAAFSA